MSWWSRSEILIRQKLPLAKQQAINIFDTSRRNTIDLVSGWTTGYKRYRGIFQLRSDNLIQEANRIINQVTGSEECEKLRMAVKEADKKFQKVKEELRSARGEFDKAIQMRSQCQKELNGLLQRKQAWIDEDLIRFTELYRKEMRLEQVEAEAKSNNERLESEVDQAHQSLMDSLRERYQEEQLWSDKIRRLSTFGTFSLMGVNVLLFLLIQLYIEPKKRKKFIGNVDAIMDQKLFTMQREISQSMTSQMTKMENSMLNQPLPSVALLDSKDSTIFSDKKDFVRGIIIGSSALILLQILNRIIST